MMCPMNEKFNYFIGKKIITGKTYAYKLFFIVTIFV